MISWTIPDPVGGGMYLENPSRSGGVAMNGQEQVVSTLSMRQRAQWTIPVRRATDTKHIRRFLALAQGKAVDILVPVFEPQKGRTANVITAAAARDTVIEIHLSAGPTPEEGRHFGIGDRAYLAKDVTALGGAGDFSIRFFPPLRVAADVTDTVLFDEAVCLMNLTNDATPLLLDLMRFATLELEFVEAF